MANGAVKEKESNKAAVGLGLLAAGTGVGALIASLTRPSGAYAGTPEQPVNVIVDGDVRQALAALILQGQDIQSALDTVNANLAQLISLAGGTPETQPGMTLYPFKKVSQTLTSGTPYPLKSIDAGSGALLWALVDVSDPDTTVIIRIDDLDWEFKYSTLYDEGVDRPLFPGAWLSKYDAGTGHYALIFSSGDVTGFKFYRQFSINVRFNGAGTATLNEGRGVLYEHP